MAKLGINGKVVDITNIAKKSKAQFAAQLKQAGVAIDDDRLEAIYTQLHDSAIEKEETKGMAPEEKRAYFDQKHPEIAAEREARQIEARQKAEATRMQAELIAKKRAESLAIMKERITR